MFSTPAELRGLAAAKPDVLGAIERIFAEEIDRLTKRLASIAGAATGSIGCPQRFGSSLNLPVHLHTLAIDGVFDKTDDGGVRLQALFTRAGGRRTPGDDTRKMGAPFTFCDRGARCRPSWKHGRSIMGSEGAAMTAIRLAHAPLLIGRADDADEEEARAAAAPCDKARLRAVVDEHFDFIWRSLQRMSVPPMDLQDCVQQVFLVASRKLASIAEGSERSFLLGTAIRVAADARRTVERRREVSDEELSEPCCPAPQPDEIADQRRLRALLDEVLAAMPEDLRVVFVLFELEDVPTQEIAALLKLPSGTVASRLRRAREEFDRRVARLRGAPRGGKR